MRHLNTGYAREAEDDGIRLVDHDPARDLPRRDSADAPHPLAPVAECDSGHLWCTGDWDTLKWAREPGTSYLSATYDRPLEGSR